MGLRFKMIPVCYQDAKYHDGRDTEFLLEYDDWNDFGYRTTFHLHASKMLTGSNTRYLGTIHIMHYAQTSSEGSLAKYGIKVGTIIEQFPEDVVSISFALDLYRGVSQLLPNKAERQEFAAVLRLLFDTQDSRYEILKDDECFNTSILRNASMDSFALRKGKQYMFDERAFYDLEQKTLRVKFTRSAEPIDLNFSTPVTEDGDECIPYSMIAFIGHNGCGKSTLLYQIARYLYASQKDRKKLKEITIEPSDIGITKLLMFSYSAFDNFLFPGVTLSDYRLMAEGVETRNGRFVYCGVRDVAKEMESYIKDYINKKEAAKEQTTEEEGEEDTVIAQEERINEIALKPISKLAEEFFTALQAIGTNETIRNQWIEMGNRCLELLPSLYADIKPFVEHYFLWGEITPSEFLKLSTGVKFFLHIMSHIYAYNEDNSVLLFDEPENHLHPPMLSFMMNEIRRSIRKTHSVMLVATHSPVIVQELFAHNVFVVRREGDDLLFGHPKTETFGENFGYINNLVFSLNSDMTNFHEVFHLLYDKWNCYSVQTPEEVVHLFEERLKCQSLSSQMVAYLVNMHLNMRRS